MPYAEPLTDDEISERLSQLPGWERDGDSITKTYRSRFVDGLAIITRAVVAMEVMNHHADMVYMFGSVRFTITTHAADHKITGKDMDLAEKIEKAAQGLTR
ncbi:4a-hydroxytetrahydrobiopterin dehydratase [Catenulispora sp. GAS73]|uniref:4a-hydroxytetrahydrobiopterin dehydratase n=1 Tax=Catenulispora sp. GAS73 TaxID=3156269 RepID=UPI003510EB69